MDINNKHITVPILIFCFLGACSRREDFARELELLEMERTQLMKKQELMNRRMSREDMSPEPVSFPMKDTQLLLWQLQTRSMTLDEDRLFSE